MAKSPVRYLKHPAKFNADTLNATRNAKSPANRALKIAHGRAHTVDAVRCPAPSSAVFFHVPKDAGRRSTAVINVHRYVVKSVRHLNIVRSVSQRYQRSDGGLHSTSYV